MIQTKTSVLALASIHRNILTIESYYEYDAIDYRFSKDYAKMSDYLINNNNSFLPFEFFFRNRYVVINGLLVDAEHFF